jgi:hypothetical protein
VLLLFPPADSALRERRRALGLGDFERPHIGVPQATSNMARMAQKVRESTPLMVIGRENDGVNIKRSSENLEQEKVSPLKMVRNKSHPDLSSFILTHTPGRPPTSVPKADLSSSIDDSFKDYDDDVSLLSLSSPRADSPDLADQGEEGGCDEDDGASRFRTTPHYSYTNLINIDSGEAQQLPLAGLGDGMVLADMTEDLAIINNAPTGAGAGERALRSFVSAPFAAPGTNGQGMPQSGLISGGFSMTSRSLLTKGVIDKTFGVKNGERLIREGEK